MSIETRRGNYLKAEEETTESECDSLESNLKKTGKEKETRKRNIHGDLHSAKFQVHMRIDAKYMHTCPFCRWNLESMCEVMKFKIDEILIDL